MRSTKLAAGLDIVDLLRQEHIALRALCSELSGWSPAGPTVHLEFGDRLLRHEIAEELVVYPVLSGYQGGAGVATGRLDDQADIERRLLLLGREEPGSKEFRRLRVGLVIAVLTHLDKEDSQVLPILASRLGMAQRLELGRKFREITEAVPPHHHPRGVRIATGPTVVDRTSALSVWMRDTVASSGLTG